MAQKYTLKIYRGTVRKQYFEEFELLEIVLAKNLNLGSLIMLKCEPT